MQAAPFARALRVRVVLSTLQGPKFLPDCPPHSPPAKIPGALCTPSLMGCCTLHSPGCAADLVAGTDPSAIVEHGQFCREPEQCKVGWAGTCIAQVQQAVGHRGWRSQHSACVLGSCCGTIVKEYCQTSNASHWMRSSSPLHPACSPRLYPQEYARGRVALVGDAAHLATAMLGMGCSLALEDACELGRAIGEHGITPAALQAYQAVRVPAAGEVQAASVQVRADEGCSSEACLRNQAWRSTGGQRARPSAPMLERTKAAGLPCWPTGTPPPGPASSSQASALPLAASSLPQGWLCRFSDC